MPDSETLFSFPVMAQEMLDFWTPDRFIRQTYAQDENGKSVEFNSPEAVKFCFYGALQRLFGAPDQGGIYTAFGDRAGQECQDLYGHCPLTINDEDPDGYNKLHAMLEKIAKGE